MGEKLVAPTRGIIFAGGEILNYNVVKSIIRPDDLLICADSGYLHCVKMGIKPHFIVGDFDSLVEIPEDVPKVNLPEDKNYTDTTFAIESAIHQGCDTIILVGMLGGRLDHTFANIQSLAYCTHNGIKSYILDGKTQVFCAYADGEGTKKITLAPIKGYYFSILSFSEQCVGVTIENGKYPLDDYTLKFDMARAVSNEFIGKEVNITFESGTLLVILTPKDH